MHPYVCIFFTCIAPLNFFELWGLAILGLENNGGVKIYRIQGDLLVCGGLHFPEGLDFEELKALFWHWKVPVFRKNVPAADHFILI